MIGLVARTARARELLRRDPARMLRGDGWWIEPHGHVAVRAPQTLETRGLVIAACGDVHALASVARRHAWTALASVPGAFAFAVWDARNETVTLARDRIGQRTLHTRETRDALWFASDPELLLRLPGERPTLDVGSAVAYLARGHAPLGRTLASEVRALPAAHYAQHERDRLLIHRYWTPLRPAPTRRAVVTALRERLVAAVTPAESVLLSGGVDSSIVTCLAAKRGPPPVAFTLQSGDNDADVRYAATVARAVRARHVVVDIDAAEATKLLPGILAAAAPMGAWTAISHARLLAAIANEGLSTVLSGLGADELFGGYDRFLDYFYRQRRYARGFAGGADWFDGLIHDLVRGPVDLFPGIALFCDSTARGELLSDATNRLAPSDTTFYAECRQIDPRANTVAMMGAHEAQHRIPELLLQTFEPLARQAGVDLTYPYLDREVAHLAMTLGIDDHFWFEGGAWWAKRTLRAAARGIVPPKIIMRPRIGYDVPFAAWMRDRRFGALVVDRLAATRLWHAGLFRRSARALALREARAVRRGETDACDRTWALLTLGGWYDSYLA